MITGQLQPCLPLTVLKAVFTIDGQRILLGKQPALCLSQMQRHRARLTTGGQQLLKVVHVGSRLVLRRKLLQRNKSCGQCLGDHPFVVACDALLWQWTALPIILSPLAPGSLAYDIAGRSIVRRD